MGMLTDVPGVHLGHVSLGDTGVSVVVAPEGAVAGVDVRGGGPGTRETDLLEPHNTVDRVHAVALCGGSAYGLAAADGVMRALEERGIGFKVAEGIVVPIVPAAVIFDLFVGDPGHRPRSSDGYTAVAHALERPGGVPGEASSSVGAGCGATAGRLRGGFGQAATTVEGFTVAAGVVANPVGEVIDALSGRLYGAPLRAAVDVGRFAAIGAPETNLNTTIGVIATDAPLTKAQAKRLALSGHDGIARAVRPSHLPMDGDTLFAISTGDGSGVDTLTLARLCAAAAECVQAAIIDAITSAGPGHGLATYLELTQ
ncbi:P1 family peptidase [Corynebacterium pacaense]|uniref:P1 family peptidase n=1 Tax=Corynebacterium pacaense TaxID=1816684 RepID=UPI0015C4D02E|nr:P1 family peptidase [Corynebacterium pacaense]